MLADSALIYLAVNKAHKHTHGDPLLLLFVLLFFGWVAYLFMVSLWHDDSPVKKRDDEDRLD